MTDHIPLSAAEDRLRALSFSINGSHEIISLQAALDALRGVAGERDEVLEAVERYDVIEHHISTGLGAEMEQNEYGDWVKHDDYAALLAAKEAAEAERDQLRLACRIERRAKEAAEAERDAVISDLKNYMQIANDEADRAQSAEAEAAALRERLTLAMEAGGYLMRAFDAINDSPRKDRADDVFLIVKNGSRVASVSEARATLDQPKEGEDNDG